MPDPFAAADRLAAGIGTADDQAWLREGLRRWQRAGGALALDRCLGLTGRRRGVLARRDDLLAELRGVVGGPEAMLRAIARFQACEWPRWDGLTATPAGADYRQRILFDLLSLRCSIPTTARGLRMRNERACKPSPRPAAVTASSARRHPTPESCHAHPNP